MFENRERSEISDLGEFGLISHLNSFFTTRRSNTIAASGDDAAVIEIGGQNLLVSTDHMLEGIHFDLSFHPLMHLGYKLVAAGISDICAMNGKPSQILVNIGMSNRFSLEAVEEIFRGIQHACDKYNLDLVGGDTSASFKGLMLNVTALGTAEKNAVAYRKGARPNDLLVVSGDLGGAYMGLQILEREKKIFLEQPDFKPDLEQHDYIIGRQLRPEARTDVVDLLETLGIVPTSMIDVSDGVASEIHHLGKHSGVGFEIFEDKLPIDPQTVDRALEFNLNPSIVALNGGEDYELLFTVAQEHYDKIKSEPDLTIIGHATEQKGVFSLNNRNGQSFAIKAQGWEHFKA